jgi:hypothetical protein
MSVKSKIVEALGCTLDDISEERLVDILLDSYRTKKQEISRLQVENIREREDMYRERQSLRDEQRRMRSDPLYGPEGYYYFLSDRRKFTVAVQGGRITMSERMKNVDMVAQQVQLVEWLRS